MVRSSLLVALKPIDFKPATLVKTEILEISRKPNFHNILTHVLVFPTEMWNAEISPVTFLKK